MSRIYHIKARLEKVNQGTLRKVLEYLDKKGKIKLLPPNTIVKDYYGRTRTFKNAIGIIEYKGIQYARNIAVLVENGKLVLKGDFYGKKSVANKLLSMITDEYLAMATLDAIKSTLEIGEVKRTEVNGTIRIEVEVQ